MCKYTTIFTIVDDFCKTYKEWVSDISSQIINGSGIHHIMIDLFK